MAAKSAMNFGSKVTLGGSNKVDAGFKAPTGLPTVFDPSFLVPKAGQKPGLEIWRVEAKKVVKKDIKDECYKGSFCQGDSYLVLSTKVNLNLFL